MGPAGGAWVIWASGGEVCASGGGKLGLYGPQKGKAAALSLRVTRAMELSLEAIAFRLKASMLAW